MSKFFVGQRVRLVLTDRIENKDATGTIAALGHWGPGDTLPNGRIFGNSPWGHADCIVDWDRHLFGVNGTLGKQMPCACYRLEPILPSGHRSGDYSYTELMDRLKAGEVECV